MIQRVIDIITSAKSRVIDSAVDYTPVVFASGKFTPNGDRVIRAFHVNTDGTMQLLNLNGQAVTFTVFGGSTYAYTALSVIEDETTAELIALF